MFVRVMDRVGLGQLRWSGFASRHVETSVGRMHLLEAKGTGTGPPILVLHGICAAAAHFRKVLPRLLAGSRRVIAPDMPGHGLSEEPSPLSSRAIEAGARELLDDVLDEPAVVYGNSMGCVAAIDLALRRPEMVRGLLLNSPGGARVSAPELHTFLQSFPYDARIDARAFVDRLHAAPPWYGPLIAPGIRRVFSRPGMRQFIEALTVDDLLDPAALARLAPPILVLWGRADRLMPLDHYAFFRGALPAHARFEDPPELGHCPYLDRPAQLADRILAFSAELGA